MPDPTSTHDKFTCPKCGHELGTKYYIDSVFMGAMLGGMYIEEAKGHCPNCGKKLLITVSAKEIIKLMFRYLPTYPVVTVEVVGDDQDERSP